RPEHRRPESKYPAVLILHDQQIRSPLQAPHPRRTGPIRGRVTMFFLCVLVPLAIVIAWALAQDWKRRHRRHLGAADMQSRIRAARESAKERAAKWMLRLAQDEQGGLTPRHRPEQVSCRALSRQSPRWLKQMPALATGARYPYHVLAVIQHQ